MKKYCFALTLALGILSAKAQETTIFDAMRYAHEDLNGTARFRAMGGAFGALGGDLSAIGINPAGSAVFANNQVGITLTSFNRTNDARYFGSSTSDVDYSLDLNQAGGVYVLVNEDQSSDWKKITVALNYDNVNNFDNTTFVSGVNPTASIANYFLSFANDNNVLLGDLGGFNYGMLNFAQWQTLFGYEGFVINPVSQGPQSTLWVSNVPDGGNYYHEHSMVSTGYNGKLSFNGAVQYQDWLYLGLNLNSHFSDFRQSTSFFESNQNNAQAGLQRVRFNNDLVTFGNGFSFGLGAIAKVNEALRLGVSYESPKWLRLEDRFTQSISFSTVQNGANINNFFDPQQILIFDYRLQTPSRFTGSFAYVFGKSGLISIDYSMRNFSNTRFRPESAYFDLNQAMLQMLTNTSEIRVGAEKKLKQWSLRAGYRFEQSPYENNEIMGDLNAFSGGLGYNFGEIRADISYTHARRDMQMPLLSRGLGSGADINSINNNVTLTILFEL